MKIKKVINYLKERKSIVVLIIIVITVTVFGFIVFNDEKIVTAVEKFNKTYQEDYVIEIKGEVNRAGIYSVGSDCRINDIILLAEGVTDEADISGINLAEKITDGMILVIPKKTEVINNEDKISINSADKDTLMKLTGIGEVRALAIIEYRSVNGKYNYIEELVEKNIISQNVFDKIKNDITI